jgi:branched-chain amino acid transport system permease protein
LTAFFDILLGGVFHAAVLFLVAAGLQLVFGVQKIVNLACGSFYALGAYFGISSVNWALAAGLPPWMFLPVLIVSGIVLGAIGPAIEALLRTIYARDEAFQLLLTFALVLIFQDVLRFFWGPNPQQLGNLANDYGSRIERYTFVADADGDDIVDGEVIAVQNYGGSIRHDEKPHSYSGL